MMMQPRLRTSISFISLSLMMLSATAADPPKSIPVREKEAIILIDQAVKAAGGVAELKKQMHIKFKCKYIETVKSQQSESLDVTVYRHPDALRIEIKDSSEPSLTVVCQNRDVVWATVNAKRIPVNDRDKAKRITNTHLVQIKSLYPLLHDATYSLTKIPERKFGKDEYQGVAVKRADMEAVLELYFNKESKLLEYAVRKDPGLDDSEVHFSDYKLVNGCKLYHTETIRYGDNIIIYQDLQYTILSGKDEALFTPPEEK